MKSQAALELRRDAPPTHWVKYVRWDVITRWRKQATLSREHGTVSAAVAGDSLDYPYAFASRDAAFRAIGGGVLWLISAPRYGAYRMPPSLIARLHIDQVVSRDNPVAATIHSEVRRAGQWIAVADRDRSVYLPLNNASHVLRQLRFRGTPQQLPPEAPQTGPIVGRGPYTHLPSHFQRHRVLTPSSAARLQDYADAVEKGRRLFLSYRWCDFTDDHAWLSELTGALVTNRTSCWWDRWDVPQDDLDPIEPLLADILGDAIRQAAFLVALMRPGYLQSGPDPSRPTWVRQEWDQAGRQAEQRRRHRMSRVAVIFGDPSAARSWIETGDVVVPVATDAPAHDVAQRVISVLPQ